MPDKQIRQIWSLPKALPGDLAPAVNGSWVIATAEVPPEDERGGDIVRVSGMKVPAKIPLLAQHMHAAPDGSPTILGSVVEFRDALVPWKDKAVKAKLARFEWADTELARKYRALWGKEIDSVSIGAMVKRAVPLKSGDYTGGFEYTDTELYELSIVTVGANPAAHVLHTIKSALGDALAYEATATVEDEQEDEDEEDVDELELVHQKLDDLRQGMVDLKRHFDSEFHKLIKHVNGRVDDIESAFADAEGAQPRGNRQPAPSPTFSSLNLSQLQEALQKIQFQLSRPQPTT